jgi:hypothetical protein
VLEIPGETNDAEDSRRNYDDNKDDPPAKLRFHGWNH